MRRVRIVQKMSFDSLPKPYWIIEEVVTLQGHFIEWSGIYSSEEAAQQAVERG